MTITSKEPEMAENTTAIKAMFEDGQGVDTRLWCLHEIGADDVHPAPDFATAQRWANWANERFAEHAEICRFVVAPWPWSAESHSGGLDKSVKDWTRPDGSPVQSERDRLADAAPDLLAALREMVISLEWWQRNEPGSFGNIEGIRLEAARAALLKASPRAGEGV